MEKEQQTVSTGTESLDEGYLVKRSDGSASIYFELAEGSVVRRDDFNTVTWDNDTANWGGESVPSDAKEQIKKAVKYFTSEPIVFKSINLLAQLANDSFKIQCEDADTETFYTQWWKDIGGDDFLSWFFLEFFRSGNVPIFKTLIPYVPQNYDPDTPPSTARKTKEVAKQSIEAKKNFENAIKNLDSVRLAYSKGKVNKKMVMDAEKTYAAMQKTWQTKAIPGAYTILNPLSIKIEGPSDLPWLRLPKLMINDEIKKAIKNPSKEVKDIVSYIPKEVVSEIKKGNDSVLLPDYLCTIVTKDKQPYEVWATPLCTSAFDALDFKKELRTMDKHTVRGVRNRILKVTIGNNEFPVLDNTALKQLAKEFNNPSRNLTIFWNHTLSIEYVEPDLDSLKVDKYEPVMEEIRTCFGIAKVLTGNDGNSLGNNVLNLKGLVEVLSEAQKKFLTWFHQEAKRVSEATAMPKIPEATFGQLNLKDENEYIRVLSTLVDRQIISYETMVDTLGYHFPKEIDRLKKEKELRDTEGILVPQKAPTQMEVSSPTGNDGRPANTPEGKRPSRENKTKMPGDASASVDLTPFTLAKTKDTVVDYVKEYKDTEIEKLKTSGKRLTNKRSSEIGLNAISYAVNKVLDDENKASDIIVMAAMVVEKMGKTDASKEDAMIDFVSYYIGINQNK